MKQAFGLLIVIFLLSNNIYGQHSKPDTLLAMFYNDQIKLDGKLNEPCWLNAPAIENFTQREQNEGAPATEKTRIAVVYNTNEIFFGIWCFDSEPEKISAQQMAHDFCWSSDDNIEIMISPFNDNRNGYLFVTNPNGAMADIWIGSEGKDFIKDWNSVWDVAVEINEKGWFAEIVIPFSTLKFKKDSEQIWGINFERNIRRKKEQLMWQGWSRLYDVEKISQGGKLTGINNIKQGTKIEIKPYVLGGFEFTEGETKNTGKMGGEVNFDITPTLKLNFTANTDFAQVESDRKQINLSRFSLYYPEKRQFFLEGQNYYDMNVDNVRLFYSRRIGIEQNTEVPIIGGMRFFGKLNKTNIGIMSIQTSSKDSIPTTNYSVIKVKQDIFKQSSIGVIATQKYSENHYNRVIGTSFIYSTSKLFGEKNLVAGGIFAVSDTKNFGETENLNKDNLSYHVFVTYPNDQVEFDFGFTTVESGFNPEMGFASRNNYQMFYTELQFNPRFKNLPFFRNLILKPIDINYYINNETKKLESVFYEWRPLGFVTKSGEFLELNIQHIFDKPSENFELIDSVFIPAGSYWDNRLEVQFSTFKGRKISAYACVNIGEFYTGHRQEYELYTNFNLSRRLNLGFDWQRNYVQLPQKSFTTDELGGRIDYAFNPKLQTSLFTQWNNEDKNILVNYRINWIPKIGSFFYFVINQEYTTDNGIKLERTTIIGKLIWRFAL
ncbi:MAG: carbohydrate binding family 9 domain-containing protein [Bacteroidales bacterium]|nr:carbohydrate binding family 9 domain-containing protein [Bacteroidales bacterium]